MPRQIYPQSRRPANPRDDEIKLRFLPDSPEAIIESMKNIGYHDKLEKVVREAIVRVNRR